MFQTSQSKNESDNHPNCNTMHADVEDDLENIHNVLRKVFENYLGEFSKQFGH